MCMYEYVCHTTLGKVYQKTLFEQHTRPADDRTIDEVCINVFFFLESERVDPFFFFFLLSPKVKASKPPRRCLSRAPNVL